MDYPSREVVARIIEILLKNSKAGKAISVSDLSERALVSEKIARKMLFSWGISGDIIELSEREKIDIIIKALEYGVEGERVSRYLEWTEFEKLVAKVLERAGYRTRWNVRIPRHRHRYQIDLLAYRGNLVLLIDCKHWKRPPPPSAEFKMVEAQERRLMALRSKLEEEVAGVEKTREIYLVPMVLSLYQPSRKILNGHLFASIGNLRSLLEYVESAYFQIRHEKVKLPEEEDFIVFLTRIQGAG